MGWAVLNQVQDEGKGWAILNQVQDAGMGWAVLNLVRNDGMGRRFRRRGGWMDRRSVERAESASVGGIPSSQGPSGTPAGFYPKTPPSSRSWRPAADQTRSGLKRCADMLNRPQRFKPRV